MNASPPLPGWACLGDGILGPRWLRIVLAAALVLAAARLEMSAQQGVGDLPRITNQPQSQIVLVSATVSFHVGVAASATPLSYQWHFSSMSIPDATNATLWLFDVQTNQAGQYWVTVVNAAGSGLPEPLAVTLTVIGPGGVGCMDMPLGSTATQLFDNFGVTNQPNEPSPCGVSGGSSRWRCLHPEQNGICIIDTVGSDFDTVLAVYTFTGTNLLESLTPVICDTNGGPSGTGSLVRFSAVHEMNYLVQVDGIAPQQGNLTLTWRLGRPPIITQQPANLVVATEGGKAMFSCMATGKPAPGYQWRFNGTNIAGATGPQLILNHVQPAAAGLYHAVVSNFIGVTNSEAATLQVTDPVRLEVRGFTNDSLRLQVTGPPGPSVRYVLEASTNILNWTAVATNDAPSGEALFLTPVAPGAAQRFYRAFRP